MADYSGVVEEEVGERPALEQAGEAFHERRGVGAGLNQREIEGTTSTLRLVGHRDVDDAGNEVVGQSFDPRLGEGHRNRHRFGRSGAVGRCRVAGHRRR